MLGNVSADLHKACLDELFEFAWNEEKPMWLVKGERGSGRTLKGCFISAFYAVEAGYNVLIISTREQRNFINRMLDDKLLMPKEARDRIKILLPDDILTGGPREVVVKADIAMIDYVAGQWNSNLVDLLKQFRIKRFLLTDSAVVVASQPKPDDDYPF